MKKTLLVAVLLAGQISMAGPARVTEVVDRAGAKEFVSKSKEFSVKVIEEMRAEFKKVKEKTTEYVQQTRLSAEAKTEISTYLKNALRDNAGFRTTYSDQIAEAIALRPDILADVTLLIAQGDKENLELIGKFAVKSNFTPEKLQLEIAALNKVIILSKQDGNSLQAKARKVLEILKRDGSKTMLEVLKEVGFTGRLEDLIIC